MNEEQFEKALKILDCNDRLTESQWIKLQEIIDSDMKEDEINKTE